MFTRDRTGFDATIGNPPWDVIKPNSQEFFTEFDPLYRTYDKQAAVRKQAELFDVGPALADQWDEYNARFKALGNWARSAADPFDMAPVSRPGGDEPGRRLGQAPPGPRRLREPRPPVPPPGQCRPQLLQDVHRGLLEPAPGRRADRCHPADRHLLRLRHQGPAGNAAFGGRLEFLYAFQNEKKVFSAAHHRSSRSPCSPPRAAALERSAPGSAWVWATRRTPTKSPTTS